MRTFSIIFWILIGYLVWRYSELIHVLSDKEANAIIESIRTVFAIAVAYLALLGYLVGKKYFVTGHNNQLSLEDYKQNSSAVRPVISAIHELQRVIQILFEDDQITTPKIEYLLAIIDDLHRDINFSSREAMHINGISKVRTSYFKWYTCWIEDADKESFFTLSDREKRTNFIDRHRQTMDNQLKAVANDLRNLHNSLRPATKV